MVTQYVEKHGIKIQLGVAITALIFIIGTTYNMARFTSAMEANDKEVSARVDHLSDKYVTLRNDMTVVQAQGNEVKIKLATLEAILLRIENSIAKFH